MVSSESQMTTGVSTAEQAETTIPTMTAPAQTAPSSPADRIAQTAHAARIVAPSGAHAAHVAASASAPHFRAIREDDIPAVARLDRETWFDRAYYPTDESFAYASHVDVLRYLPHTTYGRVALDADGSLLGLALGTVRGDAPALPGAARLRSDRRAQAGNVTGGERIVHDIDADIDVNHMLLESARRRVHGAFDAELQLFIVSPRARGRGIGGRLFSGFLDHLRSRGVSRYFLFTDSGCSYGFYDAHGLERVAETPRIPSFCSDELLDKYVYAGRA